MRLRIPLQNQWKLNGSSRQVHSGSSTPLENLNRGKCYQLHFGFKQTATHHSTLQGLSCNPLKLFNDNTYEIIQDDKKKKKKKTTGWSIPYFYKYGPLDCSEAYLAKNFNDPESSIFLSTTNWDLPRTLARDWTTTRAFPICLCRDWTLWSCSCWLSVHSEGVQCGERHFVHQGFLWNKSLDS